MHCILANCAALMNHHLDKDKLMSVIDVYWSFRSPFSYIAVSQLKALQQDFDIKCFIKPVYPLAVRDDSFFKAARPQQFPYFVQDMTREAAKNNIPFRWPVPDPIEQDLSTMTIAKEQPRIDRLMLLGAAVQREAGEDGFSFFEEVSKIIFDGETDHWEEGNHMAAATRRAGFDWVRLEKSVTAHKSDLVSLIEKNEAEQQRHHWGVPLMVYKDEPFFGQDRISTLRWRIEQERS